MSTNAQPSVEQLKRALVIAEQIKDLEDELASILQNSEKPARALKLPKVLTKAVKVVAVKAPDGRSKKKHRVMSPEAREKIASAQRARWAKTKGGN